MSVPDYRHVPRKLFETGLYNLKTEDGQAAFTDAVVGTLHGLDERWGHLKKKPGQSQVHGHGEDSALYLADEPGHSQAVDFIGGAGGSNPQPGWIVDEPRYSASDWRDPFDHGFDQAQAPPPSPQVVVMPKGEAFTALKALNAFYAAPDGLQRPEGIGGDMEAIAQWFYQLVIEGISLERVKEQIRDSHEWRTKHP